MKRSYRETGHKGFTLIELLIVMAIIAILIGMLFAGITGVMKARKKVQALAMISTMSSASRSYWSAYGCWPYTATETIVNSGTFFVNCMSGNDTILNPRGIRFMVFPQSSLVGASPSQLFVDSYGKTSAGGYTLYSIYYDTN